MFRYGLARILNSRLFSSVNNFMVEPEVGTNPRTKKRPGQLCEAIKNLGPNINWKEFHSKHHPINRNFDRIFECQVLDCLIVQSSDEEPEIDGLRRGFLAHLRDVVGVDDSSPIVLQLGFCALLGKVDPVSYPDEISGIIKSIISKKGLVTRFPMFSHCLAGLSKSSKENCLLAVTLASHHRLTPMSLVAIMNNCLHHGLFEAAINLSTNIDTIDVELWVKSFYKNDFSEKSWVSFMTVCQSRNLSVPESVRNEIQEVFKNLGFGVMDTKPTPHGTCSVCERRLQVLDQEECDKLRDSIYRAVLKGSNVFMNTDPNELNTFKKFIDRKFGSRKYYDLVVDGLNALHSTNSTVWVPKSHHSDRRFSSYQDLHKQSTSFKVVMSCALENFKNILVIGRRHMTSIPNIGRFFESNRAVVDYFALKNDSKDDAFILYAGTRYPYTYVLSNDLYRDHSAIVEEQQLFDRWRASRNILVNDMTSGKQPPPPFDICVNVSEESKLIHVPVSHGKRISWLCCKKQ